MTTPITPIVTSVPVDDSVDKIEVTSEVAKRVAELLKDPTQGKPIDGDLRNKLRQQSYDDMVESIEVLTLLAHSSESFHNVLAIKKRIESGVTPTF